MAHHETDLITAFFEAYNARDVDSVEALLHPDVKITTLSARAGLPARWEGRGSTRRYFQQLDESWSELEIEVQEVREVGGGTVGIGVIRGIGKASHVEVFETFASVFVIRDALIVLIDTYADSEEALAAAKALPARERAPDRA